MVVILALVALPAIEIALFVVVGGRIGLWWTLAVTLATAVLGVMVLRRQGVAALAQVQAEIARGRDPARALGHGALLVAAGLLLAAPGFLTDALGLLLLVRPVRAAVLARAAPYLAGRVVVGRASWSAPPPDPSGAGRDEAPLDVEYRDVTDDAPPPPPEPRA